MNLSKTFRKTFLQRFIENVIKTLAKTLQLTFCECFIWVYLEPSFFNVNKTFELSFYFKRYGNVDEIVLLTFYFGLLQTSN